MVNENYELETAVYRENAKIIEPRERRLTNIDHIVRANSGADVVGRSLADNVASAGPTFARSWVRRLFDFVVPTTNQVRKHPGV